ncbi:MAG: hypothetical protein V4496_01990 [Pseudomonadota bacterium]
MTTDDESSDKLARALINLCARAMDRDHEEHAGYLAELNDAHAKITRLSKISDTLAATLGHAISLIKPEKLNQFSLALNNLLTEEVTNNYPGLAFVKQIALNLINERQKKNPVTSRKRENESFNNEQKKTPAAPPKAEDKYPKNTPNETPVATLKKAYEERVSKFTHENKKDYLSQLSTIFPPTHLELIALGLNDEEAHNEALALHQFFAETCGSFELSKESTDAIKCQTRLFRDLARDINSKKYSIEEVSNFIKHEDRENEETVNGLRRTLSAYNTAPKNLYTQKFMNNCLECLSMVIDSRNERKQEDQENNYKLMLENYAQPLRAYKVTSNDWSTLLPPNARAIKRKYFVNDDEAIALEFRHWKIFINYCENMSRALIKQEGSGYFKWLVNAIVTYNKNYTNNDFVIEIKWLRDTQNFNALANILEKNIAYGYINAQVKEVLKLCNMRLWFLKSNIDKLEQLKTFFTKKNISYFDIDDLCIHALAVSANGDFTANKIVSIILVAYNNSKNVEILSALFVNELCDFFSTRSHNSVHSKLLFTSLVCEYTHDWSADGIAKKNVVIRAWEELITALAKSPHRPETCRALLVKLCKTVAYPSCQSTLYQLSEPNFATESMQRIAQEGACLSSESRQLLGLPLRNSTHNAEEFLDEIRALLQQEKCMPSNSLGYGT